jgi:MFS family permease
MPDTPQEKTALLRPGVTRLKFSLVISGAVLILMSGTLSSQGINNIQTALLTKYDGMQYFALLSALSTMGMVIMMPIGGKLSDLYGRKLYGWIGCILFTGGSVLVAFAPSLPAFLLLRSVIPIGQACTMVICYAVIGTLTTGKGRSMSFAAISAVTASSGRRAPRSRPVLPAFSITR